VILKYRIIDTAFGHVGIAATEKGISTITLPFDTEEEVMIALGEKSGTGDLAPELLPDLVERIIGYFNGKRYPSMMNST
jgi:hypothetical protein